MIRDFFSDPQGTLIHLLYLLPAFLISLTVHELSHGYAAYKMGDPTARNMGRLTLNPIKHIDPIGMLLLLFAGFGWAKPVPVNPRYFRNYRKGVAITSAAGPLSNIALALLGNLIAHIIVAIFNATLTDTTPQIIITFVGALYMFFYYFTSLNLSLAFFNLIPLPPLDGSKLLALVLPPKATQIYEQISRYGFIIIFALINTPILSVPLSYAVTYTWRALDFIIELIPGL